MTARRFGVEANSKQEPPHASALVVPVTEKPACLRKAALSEDSLESAAKNVLAAT